jgi:hypothetical protein
MSPWIECRRGLLVIAAAVLIAAPPAFAAGQRRSRPAAPPPPPAAPLKVVPEMKCPSPLGVGIATKVSFCDVMTEPDPEAGIVITLPPHKGPVTLTFDLHNRHTYSEEQVKANRAYARYTASIGVLTLDNHLISRAVVQNEFRSAKDLVDRIGGGAGPAGLKAVAPTGSESISVTIPETENQVSILGEKVTYERFEGPPETYTSTGRPVAVISNVMIEYHPAPPPKPAPAPRRRR